MTVQQDVLPGQVTFTEL